MKLIYDNENDIVINLDYICMVRKYETVSWGNRKTLYEVEFISGTSYNISKEIYDEIKELVECI